MNRKYIILSEKTRLVKIFVDEILYCKAQGSYTGLVLKNGKKEIFSEILKRIEEKLCDFNFFRTNKSYLANVTCGMEIIKGQKPGLLMLNGETVPVSVKKLKELIKLFS